MVAFGNPHPHLGDMVKGPMFLADNGQVLDFGHRDGPPQELAESRTQGPIAILVKQAYERLEIGTIGDNWPLGIQPPG